MATPPWGHKPAKVDDPYLYWGNQPPVQSDRCSYWLKRMSDGTYIPNRWIMRECYDCGAHMLGVYIWEYINILYPEMVRIKYGN